MRIILLFILTLGVIAPGLAFGLDFEITDVIEVGPIYSGSMLRPAQWSPDGRWLAYFDGKTLMLSDTMGVSHAVAEVELVPVRFHWVGSEEIVVHLKQLISAKESLNRLWRINVAKGVDTILEEYRHKVLARARRTNRLFWDLWQTVEGNAYYRIQDEGRKWIEMVPRGNGLKPLRGENHILRAGEDGTYLVNVDFTDSTRISNRPHYPYTGPPMSLSSDGSFLLYGSSILRLSDGRHTVLDTLSDVKGYSGCSQGGRFSAGPMNPSYTEVCFVLICSDSEETESIRAGVFDYVTNQLTIIDNIIGLPMCDLPEFSPNGRDMTVLSQGQLYIIKRTIL